MSIWGKFMRKNSKDAAGPEALALPKNIDSGNGRAAASLPRRFKFKSFLKWLGISLLALFAIWTTLNIVAGIQLRHTMAELKQQGFHFSLEEIQPAKVPDEDNAAIPLRRAAEMLGSWWPRSSSKNLYPKLGQLSEIIDKYRTNSTVPLDIKTWPAAVQSELPSLVESREMEEMYGYICKVAEKKKANFGIDYSEGINALLPNLGGVRGIIRCLIVKALVESQAGKTSQAYDTLLTAQKLVSHLDSEPMLVFSLIRIACDNIILDKVQSIANSTGCSEEWAKSYMPEITKSLSRQTREKVIDMEICGGASVFEGMLQDDTKLAGYFYSVYRKPLARAVLVVLKPLIKKDFRYYLLRSVNGKKYLVAPYYEIVADLKREREEKVPKCYFLSQSLCYIYGHIVENFARHDAKVEVCRTGLALQIYKGRHGKYPDRLEQLAPDILPVVPVDPFTGKSLIYKPEGEGFLLYSVGGNRVDDHGDETLDNEKRSRDIVWRCPR